MEHFFARHSASQYLPAPRGFLQTSQPPSNSYAHHCAQFVAFRSFHGGSKAPLREAVSAFLNVSQFLNRCVCHLSIFWSVFSYHSLFVCYAPSVCVAFRSVDRSVGRSVGRLVGPIVCRMVGGSVHLYTHARLSARTHACAPTQLPAHTSASACVGASARRFLSQSVDPC